MIDGRSDLPMDFLFVVSCGHTRLHAPFASIPMDINVGDQKRSCEKVLSSIAHQGSHLVNSGMWIYVMSSHLTHI